jgi:hypothetical protein
MQGFLRLLFSFFANFSKVKRINGILINKYTQKFVSLIIEFDSLNAV